MSGEPSCTRECLDDCDCPAGAFCAAVDDSLSVCAPGVSSCAAPEDGGSTPADGGSAVDAGPSGGGAGAACTEDADCGDVRSAGGTGPSPENRTVPQECWTEAASGFPGGLCSMTGCAMNFRRDPCPTDTACIGLGSGSACLPTCDDSSDCRAGWACRDDVDADGPAHEKVCWFPCPGAPCGDGFTCASDGTCVEETEPPGPLDGCTSWSDWSCVDRSPSLCSCTCPAWPRAGAAPRIACELVSAGAVACSCTTGGDASERETGSVDVTAGGADCGHARDAFDASFCGLVP